MSGARSSWHIPIEAIGSASSAPALRPRENGDSMSKADIPASVDFSKGRRGLYASRYAAGTNVIVLDPDVARRFKSSIQVNRVLRSFMEAAAEIAPKSSALRAPKQRKPPT